MATNSTKAILTDRTERVKALRLEASKFLRNDSPTEKSLMRTAHNVSYIFQQNTHIEYDHLHKNLFDGLASIRQEFIKKSTNFINSMFKEYPDIMSITSNHMASSDMERKNKIHQTPCKFFKKNILDI